MVICSVENKHTRTSASSSIVNEVLDHFHRLLHEVDRGRISCQVTERNTRNFVRKNIVCRFGISKVIISDNARQFDNDIFKLFCSDLAISNHLSSPSHPQANGQVEVTNRTIIFPSDMSSSRGQPWPGNTLLGLFSWRPFWTFILQDRSRWATCCSVYLKTKEHLLVKDKVLRLDNSRTIGERKTDLECSMTSGPE